MITFYVMISFLEVVMHGYSHGSNICKQLQLMHSSNGTLNILSICMKFDESLSRFMNMIIPLFPSTTWLSGVN